ncbi:MAG: hypothetical protein ACERKZ_12505 [Lachnotalea sp.]
MYHDGVKRINEEVENNVEAEAGRVSAKLGRVQAENIRESAETTRSVAEQARDETFVQMIDELNAAKVNVERVTAAANDTTDNMQSIS